MKNYAALGILFILAGLTYMYKEDLIKVYYDYFVKVRTEVVLEKNEYYRDYDFNYVQNTDNFSPKNKQDLMNIIYTFINSGSKEITFYCPKSYKKCTDDVKDLANDQLTLSSINNYVHPFNSFKNISTETDSLGTVTFRVTKSYTEHDIEMIKAAVEDIKEEVFNENLSVKDQLKAVHDYIIENSKYDSNRTDNNIVDYKSDIAYGPLIEGYGICGGYSDAMALFLEELKIKNFKVSSESHVWNAVNLYENTWYHLDLTWDDPVTNTGVDVLDNKYFLIDTNTLQTQEKTQHNFNIDIYSEFK